MGLPNTARQLACTTCAKAKSRCIPGPQDSGRCERCNRLDKPCLSRTPAPPRPKTQTKRSRVAELEKRLSELSSHFKGAIGAESSTAHSESPEIIQPPAGQQEELHELQQNFSPEGAITSPEQALSTEVDHGFNARKVRVHVFPPMDTDDPSAWPSREAVQATAKILPLMASVPWPMGEEADRMLERYHNVAAHLIPYVVVPKDLTSEELRVQRPFLWKGIMVACAFVEGKRQQLLGEKLIEEIGRSTLSGEGQNLDTLQGLLLLISWYHHALKAVRVVHLLFLTRSMCLNLDLGLGCKEPRLERLSEQDLDHIRAYAGTYYLNTMAFTTNKRVDVFMHTSYLESCCNVLETAKRLPSDILLVLLVRVQQIAQSISHTVTVEPSQQMMQLPLTAVVESFQGQLVALRQSIPADLKDNAMLETHISITEVLLGEVGLSESHCKHSNLSPVDRLRILWYCVRSLRSFFDIRCQPWPEMEQPRFTCIRGLDMTYGLITMARLVTLKLPGWNLEQIEQEIRIWEILDWLVEFLKVTTTTRRKNSGSDPNEDLGTSDVPGPTTEDALERLLRFSMSIEGMMKMELDKIKREAAEAYYPSPDDETGGTMQDEYGLDFWKDMIDDEGQWTMVGEFQWP